MSPLGPSSSARWISFPRVSGDEPGVIEAEGQLRQFSPRERG